MIWAELEFPTVARLFEPYLTYPPPTTKKITKDEIKQAEKDFSQLLDEHLELYFGDQSVIERFFCLILTALLLLSYTRFCHTVFMNNFIYLIL